MTTKRTQQLLILGSFLVPTFFFTNYVLKQFYTYGSSLLDVGWFTYMLTETTSWPVQNPEAIGGSFFKTHFSLFFYILSYVYRYILFFIPAPVYYSLFIGSMYGFISLSVFLVGLNLMQTINKWYLYVLLIISILSSMNGAALGLIGFPHIEIAIPSLLLLFLALYLTNRKIISYIVFVFLLTIREDAGFHIFALLMTIEVIVFIKKRQIKEIDLTLLSFAILGFIYTIITIYIQKTYFPGDNALERVYLGNPHFAHITYSFFTDRLQYFFTNREYIYIPMLFTLILSLYTKNFILLSSFVASFPWLILSIMAISNMPGTLSNYYAFPFITLSVWPIFAFLILKNRNLNQSYSLKNIVISIILITGISIFLFPNNSGNVDHKPWKNFLYTEYKTISSTQRFIAFTNTKKEKLGNILYDEPMAALFVKNLSKNEYGYLNNFSNKIKDKADSVIFLKSRNSLNEPSLNIMKEIITKNHLNYIYTIYNTNIILATNKKFFYNELSIFKKLFITKAREQ